MPPRQRCLTIRCASPHAEVTDSSVHLPAAAVTDPPSLVPMTAPSMLCSQPRSKQGCSVATGHDRSRLTSTNWPILSSALRPTSPMRPAIWSHHARRACREPTAALRQSAIRTEERRNDNFRFQLFSNSNYYNVRWCSACAAPLRRSSWLSRLRRHRRRTSSVDRVLRYREA